MKGFTGHEISTAKSKSDSGNQFGHQTCPLRAHTTSITTFFQIMHWRPRAPEYLAQMASRMLLEPAQSCLLCLLLTVPLVIMYLTGKLGLFTGMWMELRQEAGVSTGMREWSLEVTTEKSWKE